MPKETMTPLERWLAVLDHQIPDRVPMDFWGTPEITKRLFEHLGCETYFDFAKKLHLDLPFGPSARYVGPPLPSGTDEFGIMYSPIDYGSGTYQEVTNAPLAEFASVQEIKSQYQFPSPDWWDFSQTAEQLKGYEEYPLRAGGSEPLLTYKALRGETQAMMDFVLYPEIVHYCLEQLFDLAYQRTLRLYESFPSHLKPTFTYVAEDMGAQKDLMYSPQHIKEFLFPGMKKMIDLVHQAGAKVFHHNDGNITRILPDLVSLGIDILNPIQWRADRMDRQSLKNQYHNQLIFHGAVDNQHTLPFGLVSDVRQEVIDNVKLLGHQGGYILAPCHNIQPNTPIENIIAMYETGWEAGFYN